MNAVINSLAAPPAEQVDWASKTYLVVDDFIGVRQLLREALRSLGARNIDQASSGGEAMGLLNKIRGEFIEMPGLQLTMPQAAKLWGLDMQACQHVVDVLVETAFLRWTPSGTIVRSTM